MAQTASPRFDIVESDEEWQQQHRRHPEAKHSRLEVSVSRCDCVAGLTFGEGDRSAFLRPRKYREWLPKSRQGAT